MPYQNPPADWQDTVELPLRGPGATTLVLGPLPVPSTPGAPATEVLPTVAPVPSAGPAWPTPMSWVQVSDRCEVATATLAASWVLAVLTLGYLLPWAVATTRGRANHGGVAVVNLLLGWTGIGWAVALVMACAAHRTTVIQVVAAWGPPPARW